MRSDRLEHANLDQVGLPEHDRTRVSNEPCEWSYSYQEERHQITQKCSKCA